MPLTHAQRQSLERELPRAVRFDDLTRQLYATDASIYQVEPLAVAFPKSPDDTSKLVRACGEAGVPLISRGAGTGLSGGAIGEGVIADFSRFNRGVSGFDPERRTIHVEAGVVLDQLNAFLKPQGLCFGPDVATSSRATLGGMIANNSSGARAPVYGATIDHVESLDVVLADGRAATIGSGGDTFGDLFERATTLICAREAEVRARLPVGIVKRWPGYGFERWFRNGPGLMQLLGGSEGTLACITGATLRLAPLPQRKSVGVLFFDSVAEAMTATVAILDLRPAAIEHCDRVLFDQTIGQLTFKRSRAVLELDDKPCEAFLIVEFYDDTNGERLDALMSRGLGHRRAAFTTEDDMEQVWRLRKAGLSLLTGCKGPAKPTSGIEDVAVRPEQLPAYVESLQRLLAAKRLNASFYGHAASGLLHVRPVVDMHKREDIAAFRELAGEVSALVKEFKGSIAAEHGVGIARTEFIEEHLGPELMQLTRDIKQLFDPKGVLNPGKIVSDGRYAFDRDLRWGDGYEIRHAPHRLAFAAKDSSFVGNLEQCNGCGGCRKDAPTMCPTFLATGDEIMSTRGRANAIRAALDGRLRDSAAIEALELALKPCLSCKACKTECPSNVDMALLKAELAHARHRTNGVPMRDRLFSRPDLLGRLASIAPNLSNALLHSSPVRAMMHSLLGIAKARPLPSYAAERFDRWFDRRPARSAAPRGKVALWDDCFARHNDPDVGQAAVRVLEAAGYEVMLIKDRECCGRPAFSTGRLDLAADLARANLARIPREVPLVFLEPSCFSMFAEDYRELAISGADAVAQNCFLFEEFIADLLAHDPAALSLRATRDPIAVHVHCHAKALRDTPIMAKALRAIPGPDVRILNTGCCGLAGAFGYMKENAELSLAVSQNVVNAVNAEPRGATIVAAGTSCRHQIAFTTGRAVLHPAQVLADALVY